MCGCPGIWQEMHFGITDYICPDHYTGSIIRVSHTSPWSGGKEWTKAEYLLGSRQLKALPVAMSLFATHQSAISLLGLPAEVYTYGTMIAYYGLGHMLAMVACLFTTIPLMYPLEITSVYETSYMTIALLSPGLALQTVSVLTLVSGTLSGGLVIGGFTYWSASNFSQASVQRIVSLKSQKEAKRCDPLAAGRITSSNQLMPYFVMETLSFIPGFPGLYLASVFSGALSTLSSGINSLAAVTVEDILGVVLVGKKETFVTNLTKGIACVFGFAIILLAYLARQFTGPVTQLTYSVLGTTAGPTLGLFVLGATFPQANTVGAVLGSVIGMSLSVWVTVGSFFHGTRTPALPPGCTDKCYSLNTTSSNWTVTTISKVTVPNATEIITANITDTLPTSSSANYQPSPFFMYDLSYVWISPIGLIATLAFGLTLSYIYGALTRQSESSRFVEPMLLFPWARKLWRIPPPNKDNNLDDNLLDTPKGKKKHKNLEFEMHTK
ncbi:hypothetical protein Btru_071390 [Bulinus truncatus]|nr:hypothetical protein Btru_071390 [Bulinus truncatus]